MKLKMLPLQASLAKPFAAFLGVVGGFLLHIPDDVRSMTIVFFSLFIIDFFTGIAAAGLQGKLKSATARNKIFGKIGQYFCVVAIAGATAAVAKTWLPVNAVILAICGVECLSIWENGIRFSKYSGIDMKRFGSILDASRKYFSIDTDDEAAATEKLTAKPLVIQREIVVEKDGAGSSALNSQVQANTDAITGLQERNAVADASALTSADTSTDTSTPAAASTQGPGAGA
jgi:phage-related holin